VYIVCNILSENLFYSTSFRMNMEYNGNCNVVPHYKAFFFIVLLSGGQCSIWLVTVLSE
jgi:hypothetical protein